MSMTDRKSERPRVAVAFAAVFLLVVTSLLALFAADFGYTMFALGAWTPNYWLDRAHIARTTSQPDPELGFVRKPNVVWRGTLNGKDIEYRADENGFRNPPGVKQADVAFIGDSFTEAAHITEQKTFVRLVAQGGGLNVINLGRGAYGPQQELIVLKRYALQYRPRTIVWQFFTGNDVNDAEEFAKWVRSGHRAEASLLTRYLNSSLLRRTVKDVLAIPTRGTVPATLRYTDGRTEQLRVLYEREPEIRSAALAEIRRTLDEGARICRDRGIRLIVFTIPTMLHILQPYIHFEHPAEALQFVEGRDAQQRSQFTQWLDRTCHATPGCTFIDVWSALHEAAQADNRELYIPNDEHLDARGHEVIAKAVLAELRTGSEQTANATTLHSDRSDHL